MSATEIPIHRFEAITGEADGRLPAPTVDVIDATVIVVGARSLLPNETPDSQVSNPEGDLRRLVIGWGGSPCDTHARLTFTRTPDDRLDVLLIRHVGELTECDQVMRSRHVVLELAEDVRAAGVQIDEQDFPGQYGSQPWGPLAVVAGPPTAPHRVAGTLHIGTECVTIESSAGSVTLVFLARDAGWQRTDDSIWFRDEVLNSVHLTDGQRFQFAGVRNGAAPEWVVRPRASCPPDLFFVASVVPST